MQVQELYKLTKWVSKNVVDNQVEKLYQTLFTVLDQNSKRQNNRASQPFEEQKAVLLENLAEIEFSSLTNAQIKALEQLNLYNNIGQRGCDKIEEIMGNTLDIAHVAASINKMKSEITAGVANSKAIFDSLTFLELESDDDVPEGKVLTRLTFDNVASIKDITQLEKWSDNWADISRGFAISVGQRPEDVEIISASRGSFILDLAIYTTLAMPILKALKMVGDCLLKVQKLELNSLNIRKLKLELPAMELQLEEQANSSDELAQTLKEEIVTEITAEIKASINDFVQENEAALSKAVRKLTDFIHQGGGIDFVVDDNESEEDGEGDNDEESLKKLTRDVKEYTKMKQILLLVDKEKK